jgi:hypothetical protein
MGLNLQGMAAGSTRGPRGQWSCIHHGDVTVPHALGCMPQPTRPDSGRQTTQFELSPAAWPITFSPSHADPLRIPCGRRPWVPAHLLSVSRDPPAGRRPIAAESGPVPQSFVFRGESDPHGQPFALRCDPAGLPLVHQAPPMRSYSLIAGAASSATSSISPRSCANVRDDTAASRDVPSPSPRPRAAGDTNRRVTLARRYALTSANNAIIGSSTPRTTQT